MEKKKTWFSLMEVYSSKLTEKGLHWTNYANKAWIENNLWKDINDGNNIMLLIPWKDK